MRNDQRIAQYYDDMWKYNQIIWCVLDTTFDKIYQVFKQILRDFIKKLKKVKFVILQIMRLAKLVLIKDLKLNYSCKITILMIIMNYNLITKERRQKQQWKEVIKAEKEDNIPLDKKDIIHQ